MRRILITITVLCCGPVYAQVTISEAVELLVPQLSMAVVRENDAVVNGQDACTVVPPPWECLGTYQQNEGYTVGTDAAGNTYHVTGPNQYVDFGDGRSGQILQRTDRTGVSIDIARIIRQVCFGGAQCYPHKSFGVRAVSLDVTSGRIVMGLGANYCAPDVSPCFGRIGVIEILGLPQMFDTLMTFTPDSQSLSLVMPAHPDGFRSANSLQVWTGDLHSLPDWSQAQPLACGAATNQIPGQLVTVTDTLSAPAVGHGRYYITASIHQSDRRLGRQHISGAFSARDAQSLPLCVAN